MSFESAPQPENAPCVQFLPGLEEEQAALMADGSYESWAFAGWSPTPEQFEHARSVVAEAFDDPSSQAAEAILGDLRDVWLHSVEIAGLSVMVLAEMGLSREAQVIAARIAFWHDVGKADENVQSAIANSEGLPPAIRRIMESHSIISATRAQQAGAQDDVVVGALLHHRFIIPDEAIGKRPYPSGAEMTEVFAALVTERLLKNRDLATVIGVVAVTDEFSALSIGGNARAYHEPMRDPTAKLATIGRQLEQPFAHNVLSLVITGSVAA